MTGAFITPAIIKKFGLKPTFIVGAISFGLVVCSQILPAWYDAVIDDPESVKGKWYEFMTKKTFVEVA